MKSTFKKQLKADCANVFHNENEFAEMKHFVYDCKRYHAPVILDTLSDKAAFTPSDNTAGYTQGIYRADAVLYINESDVDFIPRQGARIIIERETYYIMRTSFECGEMVLGLRRLDE